MSQAAVFSCPSCAAALEVKENQTTIVCPFCGTSVVVPEYLRRVPEPVVQMAVPQIIITAPPIERYEATRRYVAPQRRPSGCSQVFRSMLALLLLGVVAVAGVTLRGNPNLTGALLKGIGQALPAYADITMTIGGSGTGSGLFQGAQYVGVDGKGNLYVSESKSRRVQKFDSAGNFVKSWMVEGKGQDSPNALTADQAGNVYVTMYSTILQYDGNSGELIKKLTGNVPGDLLFEVKTLPDGNVVAATMDGTLVWFDGKGSVTKRIDKAIENITDVTNAMPRIAVDGLSNVYMLGTFDNRAVYRFSAQGKYLNRFGSEGNGSDQFGFPLAIAVDNQGRIYVADRGGIKVFTNDGRYVDTIKLPGPGVPTGLAIDGKNNIYAALGDNVYKLVVRPSQTAK